MTEDDSHKAAGGQGSRGARTRAGLLVAARAAFAEHGYVKTRVADIIAHAGTSRGTFYGYFTDKADIMVALTKDVASKLYILGEPLGDSPADARAAVAAPEAGATLRELVTVRIDGFLRAYSGNWDVVRAWVEAGGTEPRVDDVRSGLRNEFIDTLSRIFKAEREHGLTLDIDPRVAATAMVAMVEHFAYIWRDQGRALKRAQAETLAGFWVRSLYPPARWDEPVTG